MAVAYILGEDGKIWMWRFRSHFSSTIDGLIQGTEVGFVAGIIIAIFVWAIMDEKQHNVQQQTEVSGLANSVPVTQKHPEDIPPSINDPNVLAAIERLARAKEENEHHK